MASIPDATITITDGALGLVDPTDNATAVIGVCASGTVNTVYAFTEISDVAATLTTGAAAEHAAHKLAVGGGVVYVVPVNGSVAGTAGSVTHTGTGACVVTVTGAPYDAYQVIVTIVQPGTNPAAGTATFKYSLDGGDTVSPETAVPTGGAYAITNTGLTLNFSAASLVAADTYTFNCVAPSFSSTDVTNAFNALVADPRTWKHVQLVGSAATASGQATIATALGSLMLSQESVYRFAYAIVGCPDLGDGTAGDAALTSAFASVANPRLMVCAGFCEAISVLTGRSEKRSASLPIAARRHKVAISEDSKWVRRGSLPFITKLYRDEQINRGLDAARFATLRTIVGKAGFFITNGNLMSAQGSDFKYVHHREIMDVACTVARATLVDFVGQDFRTNPANAQTNPGRIDERDAGSLEAAIDTALDAALLSDGHVVSAISAANRTDNVLSTGILRVKIRVQPKFYPSFITAELGFSNPAITQAN